LVNVLRPIGEPIKFDLNAVRSASAASSPSRSRPEPHSVPRPLYKRRAARDERVTERHRPGQSRSTPCCRKYEQLRLRHSVAAFRPSG
jgi:hypothetical protein